MAATSVGLDAAGAALRADELLADGETLQSVWRYVIVQLLDDCSPDLARAGDSVASQRFDREPPVTRAAEADAAPAALAEYGLGVTAGLFPPGCASLDGTPANGS